MTDNRKKAASEESNEKEDFMQEETFSRQSTKAKKEASSAQEILNQDLKFKVVESYKTIRANIMFSIIKSGCKSFVISSSMPAEGKSTVSVNVAISLSQTDAKVLLIDTDLRRPKVNRFLSLPNAPGLTNYLGGMSTLSEVIHTTSYPNLSVLCSGTKVPNPSEILASTQMAEMLEELKKHYDYIVLDSTPLNVVSDAYPLIKNTDGVILVVYQGKSVYKELDNTIKNLKMVDSKILGLIVNGVAADKKGKGRYYKSGYGYGYGYSKD